MARIRLSPGAIRPRSLALALALLAAAPAPAPAGSATCAGASAAVSGEATSRDVARLRGAIRCLITKERRRHDLAPLRDRRALRRAAEGHSRDMVRRAYFAHVSPSGSRPESRVRRAGYLRRVRRWELGEALGWGTLDQARPASLVQRLLASPGHRALLLDRSFRDIGIGIALGAPTGDEAEPGVTLTLTFGRVDRRR